MPPRHLVVVRACVKLGLGRLLPLFVSCGRTLEGLRVVFGGVGGKSRECRLVNYGGEIERLEGRWIVIMARRMLNLCRGGGGEVEVEARPFFEPDK